VTPGTRWYTPWLLAAPAIALVLLFAVVPIALLVRVSLTESAGDAGFYRAGTWATRAYADLLGDRFGRGLVAFTAGLGAAVAALAVAIAYPLALYIHSLPRRAKIAALGIVLLPKLANLYVVLYGLNLLLGRAGPVNGVLVALGSEPIALTHNLAGVLIGETFLILPYAILVLVLSLDRIDPALVAAARGLGASRWGAFRRITWPLSLPGVCIAGKLCLIWALAVFVGPVLLGGPEQATLGVMVQKWSQEDSNWPRAAAAAVLNLFTVVVCVALYTLPARRLTGGGRDG
jgi:ABC-type spermidine/putrescine transport system permease subunit I